MMSYTPDKQTKKLTEKVKVLPDVPGVYQFLDAHNKIIYIGKAKNLKKRVASYFGKEKYDNAKIRLMAKKISDVRFVIVETEFDALLLENTLIKKWQPRYNVLLKDDKTFPWICIKNEDFPRVFHTRTILKDGSDYYGPYASVKTMYALLSLIRQLYKLRSCNYKLTPENILQKKYKLCLEYHIGNCLGPCQGLESTEHYSETITQVRDLIKGNLSAVVQKMQQLMKTHAQKYEFEKAQAIKEKIDLLVSYQKKSTVVSTTINNVDVFAINSDDNIAFVTYFKVINGAIVQSHTITLKKKLGEPPAVLLGFAVTDIRLRLQSTSKEVIVSEKPDSQLPGIKYTVPHRGDKKHLLELAQKNVRYYMLQHSKQLTEKKPVVPGERIMQTLSKDLRLKEKPVHIECFDISNLQGTDSVAAMSVFINARPAKKEYRLFNIKTVDGPNDYASLEEVVYRRYKRLVDEKKKLPQLIIIDGGKGQLSAAVKSLDKLGLLKMIAVIGIAKKLEEIFFPNDSIPLYLDKRSESLRLIQFMRNEAHRFGIKHYRKKAEKRVSHSELHSIKGIGETTASKLLSHFKSVKAVKDAPLEMLSEIVGKAKAHLISKHFE